ncbi:hypothetical protein HOLleu_05238 [Holothuria leucospilota]|uniref:Uncharacterized protein n=1 Tax=Holothuria leucospilota TaxID=206669 RepID=A0A9Q1HEE4_HOLLE|nr:hypothetical protein HOLleu_05238 [Holothuria leucospilota]
MKASTQASLGASCFMKSIFLMSTIFTSGTFSQVPDCTKDVFITADTSFTSSDSTTLTASIGLTGEISLGKTICFYVKPELNEDIFQDYQVEIEGKYVEEYPLVYKLTLIDVTRRYPLRDPYIFAKPSLSFYCVCDCPGGSEHCTEDTDYCTNSPGPICVNVIVETAATGCPLSFLSSSTTCCSVTISPSEDNTRYIAYRLGDSETEFHFTLFSFYTSDDAVSGTPRQITAVLKADGTTDDENESEISISANKMDALDIPTSNLYSDVDGGQVMWGVQVNAINEWDFHKLGWFKVTDSTVTVEDPVRLKDVVNVNVTNCLEDEYTVTANVSYDQNDGTPWGSPLTYLSREQVLLAYYSPEGQSANVHYGVSPQMTFELPLSTPAESFYQSGKLGLGKFAVERTEVGSTIIVKFTRTTGIISGNVQSGSESDGYNILDDVHFKLPTSFSGEISITLTLLSTDETITRVCLYHISHPSDILCKHVPLEMTTIKIPPLSPGEYQTVYRTEEFKTTYFGTSPENGDNDTAGQNIDNSQGNGKDSDKGKNLKWYIIACFLVIGVITGVLFLCLKCTKKLRASPSASIV